MKPEDLITCCGAYCGTCARWHEYAAMRDAAAVIAEIADGHGFHRWMPRDVRDFDYTEFRKGLEFFSSADTWLVCRQPCRQQTRRRLAAGSAFAARAGASISASTATGSHATTRTSR